MRHQKPLRLFPGTFPLILLSTDTLGPLPKMKLDDQAKLVSTGAYAKLTRVKAVAVVMSSNCATISAENWVISYRQLTHVPTKGGLQFESKLFGAATACLKLNTLKSLHVIYLPTADWNHSTASL